MLFKYIYKPRFEKDRESYAKFKDWCLQTFREKEEKVVTRRQTYTIHMEHYDDGTTQMFRSNDGFNAIELLGICELTQSDIVDQLRGKVQVDKVVRTVVEN